MNNDKEILNIIKTISPYFTQKQKHLLYLFCSCLIFLGILNSKFDNG